MGSLTGQNGCIKRLVVHQGLVQGRHMAWINRTDEGEGSVSRMAPSNASCCFREAQQRQRQAAMEADDWLKIRPETPVGSFLKLAIPPNARGGLMSTS